MATEIPKGFRAATPVEIAAAHDAGIADCEACAQPKCLFSTWLARRDAAAPSLCGITGPNDCEEVGFFVREDLDHV